MIDSQRSKGSWRPVGFWATTGFLVVALGTLSVGLFVGGDIYDRALEACIWIGGLWGGFAIVREGGKVMRGES